MAGKRKYEDENIFSQNKRRALCPSFRAAEKRKHDEEGNTSQKKRRLHSLSYRAIDKRKKTAADLFQLVANNDVTQIRKYVDENNVNCIRDAAKSSLLHCAIKYKHLGMFYILTMLDASVDYQDEMGNTPLHYATCFNMPIMAKRLLELGANPFIVNKAGCNAQDIATTWNRWNIQYLCQNYQNLRSGYHQRHQNSYLDYSSKDFKRKMDDGLRTAAPSSKRRF